ncbi:hypothetical protein MPTK1_8g01890 [Marchantia polymorpha subsp. ruderalis]|uniref:BED-type domain-containing protein n=1 Tax=Marchantia polymorpha TaxID=3197 RepID=A0A2R6WR32_MARPO|nr:hypothetical protein MARPO_0064s0013 [Marchantia polymorpha]BBN18355.1 hypothetical protein Mp_8g01890 [Marchantia polymorpha subsp. ruderalis]|eukprot:PTQ36320.1 hypothetical protein MARPO_0064s0013 [Marchantia polymorpha]
MEYIEMVVVDDDIAMEVLAPKRTCGRSASAVWNWFTDDASPQNAKSAKCMHCKTLINHHKKSESAKVHLNSCAKFHTFMNGLNDDERPDWYRQNKKGGATNKAAVDSQRGKSQAVSSIQSSIKSFALPKVTGSMKQAFQKQMVLHYFATCTLFQRIEDVHFKEAIKILRPDDGLLSNRKQLVTTLLDQCHQELKTKVD